MRTPSRRFPAAAVAVAVAAAGAFALLALAASPLRAETVKFPNDDPAFSITFPDSWKTRVDAKDNALSAQPAPDRACVLTLREMEGVDDLAGAKAALPKFTAALAKGAGIKDLKPSQEPLEAKSPKGVPMVMAEFRGTSEAGVKMVLTAVIFQPGEDADVFVLTGVASEEEDKKIDQEAGAIVESITPV